MAKYDKLAKYLQRRQEDELRLSLAEIEQILGAMLPNAALNPVWWSNASQSGRGFIQCDAWLGAGFVTTLGLKDNVVTFQRLKIDSPHILQRP